MRVVISLIISVLVFSTGAFAASSCRTPIHQTNQSLGEPGKLKTAVLCCCPTYSGGQCCANVGFCGGFVPGCMCKFGHGPESLSFNDRH